MPISLDVEIKQEIKAITFHQMNIEKTGNQYRTFIVFDI
jgi:SHS2 domain-containing protein